MIDHKLQFKQKISRRASHEMILLFAKNSNHYHDVRFKSDADVKRAFLLNKISYDELVMKCRDYKQAVPMFENLIGSTITVGHGATMSRVNNITGEEDLRVTGPGKIALYAYWATFESAIEARDKAIANNSFSELLSAIVNGVASIEGYINYRVEVWNKANPHDKLIDSYERKVGFDEKINKWIPEITGKKLEKSIEWNDFKVLRKLRDDVAIHPKNSGYGMPLIDLAKKIDMFRTGIAGILIKLHLLFEERIPRIVIRARYAPDIEMVEFKFDISAS